MKKTCTVVFLLCSILLLSSLVQASENGENTKHSLHKGAWALQFALSGDLWHLRMTDFMGSFFSGKYQISDTRALRIGIDLSGNTEDVDHSQANNSSNHTSQTGTSQKKYSNSFQLTMQHLWFLRENNDIHFVLGFGPYISMYSYSNRLNADSYYSSEEENYTSKYDRSDKSNRYSLGIEGAIGIELFFKKNLSFLAEFHPSLGYSYNKVKTNRDDNRSDSDQNNSSRDDSTTSKSFNYRSNEVKLGLSFYF